MQEHPDGGSAKAGVMIVKRQECQVTDMSAIQDSTIIYDKIKRQ